MFENAKFSENNAGITATRNGKVVVIPADPANRDYRIVTEGDASLGLGPVTIALYVPSAPAAEEVRAEARRRIMALMNARDERHLQSLILDVTREAVRLQNKKLKYIEDRSNPGWTAREAARAAELEKLDRAIEALRTRSAEMEENPPVDYADDRYWN